MADGECIQADGYDPYVRSVTIDGQPHLTPLLTHRQLHAGCSLHYHLSPQPNAD